MSGNIVESTKILHTLTNPTGKTLEFSLDKITLRNSKSYNLSHFFVCKSSSVVDIVPR